MAEDDGDEVRLLVSGDGVNDTLLVIGMLVLIDVVPDAVDLVVVIGINGGNASALDP